MGAEPDHNSNDASKGGVTLVEKLFRPRYFLRGCSDLDIFYPVALNYHTYFTFSNQK